VAERPRISRRDFLNGVALGVAAGSSLTPLDILAQSTQQQISYPPGLMGLRGSHTGSFEVAHAVARGGAKFGKPAGQTDKTYDLVVVGGGISGLAAAFLFQQQHGGGKRVLVLDNHDDFGGHAKRNEFEVDDQRLISYGGSQSLESPGRYSRESAQLIRDIGIATSPVHRMRQSSTMHCRGIQSQQSPKRLLPHCCEAREITWLT
jgi:spermidine dehydrogenase